MIQYDRSVLQSMAELLYEEAEQIQTVSAVKYGLGLGVVGALIGNFMSATSNMFEASGSGNGKAVLGFIIGGAIGASVGWMNAKIRALLLRVEAQKLLCQAEIEANTKSTKTA